MAASQTEHAVVVKGSGVTLEGELTVPAHASAVVLFAHGSGSSRRSPRNRYVAGVLNDAGLGTLLIDLLTSDEGREDEQTMKLRFDIALLADRTCAALSWLHEDEATKHLCVGVFGASTGAAAALIAAAEQPQHVDAIVSRGGRPDLAAAYLERVRAPTLLIVGGNDAQVIELNRQAYALLGFEKAMHIVPRATHLFEEPAALEEVARVATDWFRGHMVGEFP
jgi:pimeloyl-ACP methyl ester carboxylesterase